MEINKQLEEYALLVNQALDRLTPSPDGGEYDRVKAAMRYSLEAGGKRIRPVLTLAFCELLGEKPQKALPLACAVELVHTYSLIHDDLPCMDDDDYRRGKPACHIAYDEATAMLAGDALLTLAFSLIGHAADTYGTNPAACLRAAALLADCAGVNGMVGGQVMDLADEGRQVDVPTLEKTCLLKTSALLRAACQMGAAAADADEQTLTLAGEYADYLGLAFQMVDDILDVTADPSVLGKPVGSDAEQGKSTWVTLLGLPKAQRAAEEMTQKAVQALSCFSGHEFLEGLTLMLLRREK